MEESELCCQILAVQSLENLVIYEAGFQYLWSWEKQQDNQMANRMLRLEYNLKDSSCTMKSFTEPRGRRKKIKGVGTYYRVRPIPNPALNDL